MTRFNGLILCGLLLVDPAFAQSSAPPSSPVDASVPAAVRAHALMLEAEARAMALCGTTRLVVPLPARDFVANREVTLDATILIEWSGACVEGKRDGPGVLTWQSERSTSPGYKLAVTTVAEGRFVKGQRLGLWCVTKFQTAINGAVTTTHGPLNGLGCSLQAGHASPAPRYIKQPDGRWQEYLLGAPGDTTLAAGELEVQSARLLANAAGVKSDAGPQLTVQSRDLDDLVRGSKIVMALSAAPVPLKDKRVAIVLSSQMGHELARFKLERQALIDASAGLRGETALHRARFIQFSDPDRLLIAILNVVKKHAMTAQADDDLTSLKEGGVDYALVLDWKSMTRFDQLGKYSKEAWPPQPPPAISGIACEALRGFLIGRDLKMVKQLPAFPTCQSIDISGAAGDHAYMWVLATFFSTRWGNDFDGVGMTVLGLDAFLKH